MHDGPVSVSFRLVERWRHRAYAGTAAVGRMQVTKLPTGAADGALAFGLVATHPPMAQACSLPLLHSTKAACFAWLNHSAESGGLLSHLLSCAMILPEHYQSRCGYLLLSC